MFSNNLLYAREDEARKALVYACKNCHQQKDAPTARVYVHYVRETPLDASAAKSAVFTEL
jgi:DNA-directed RNA polymerase subunit M/transcription elongation factor TFIIS